MKFIDGWLDALVSGTGYDREWQRSLVSVGVLSGMDRIALKTLTEHGIVPMDSAYICHNIVFTAFMRHVRGFDLEFFDFLFPSFEQFYGQGSFKPWFGGYGLWDTRTMHVQLLQTPRDISVDFLYDSRVIEYVIFNDCPPFRSLVYHRWGYT